ncbi:MAG TPA: hypothetical protein VF053_04510 [Streptosporangiales bacterium]
MLPAVGLFFLAPLTAEFLLGNIPITALYLLPMFALLYGSGAVLIREVARRRGWGWPTIVAWALAYGVLEEGVTTQSLFNPDYAGQHLLRPGYVHALGMGVPWTLFVLTLHTVWSISVPIAITETVARSRPTTPWLRRPGLAVTTVLFAVGVVATTAVSIGMDPFVASAGQFAGAGSAIAVLVALGVLLGVRGRGPRTELTLSAPDPWFLGAGSLAAGSAFMLLALGRGVGTWPGVVIDLALYATAVVAIGYCSRLRGFGAAHRLALAGGALLTYAWHAFPEAPVFPATPTADLIGNAVFAAGAVALLVVAALRLRSGPQARAEAPADERPRVPRPA